MKLLNLKAFLLLFLSSLSLANPSPVSSVSSIELQTALHQPWASAQVQSLGPNSFRVGISEDRFQFLSAPSTLGRQRQSNWCWAASLQMILNYLSVPISQEQIVAFSFGTLMDQPGGAQQILKVLNQWFETFDHQLVRHQAVLIDPSQQSLLLFERLLSGVPALVGMASSVAGQPGHGYVIKSLSYELDSNEQPVITNLLLADPWPESSGEALLSWPEFLRRQVGVYLIY